MDNNGEISTQREPSLKLPEQIKRYVNNSKENTRLIKETLRVIGAPLNKPVRITNIGAGVNLESLNLILGDANEILHLTIDPDRISVRLIQDHLKKYEEALAQYNHRVTINEAYAQYEEAYMVPKTWPEESHLVIFRNPNRKLIDCAYSIGLELPKHVADRFGIIVVADRPSWKSELLSELSHGFEDSGFKFTMAPIQYPEGYTPQLVYNGGPFPHPQEGKGSFICELK